MANEYIYTLTNDKDNKRIYIHSNMRADKMEIYSRIRFMDTFDFYLQIDRLILTTKGIAGVIYPPMELNKKFNITLDYKKKLKINLIFDGKDLLLTFKN